MIVTEKMIEEAHIFLNEQFIGLEHKLPHPIGVANSARELALHYGVDENSAYFAGLLHDIAKHIGKEETLKKLSEYNICDLFLYDTYKLAHGEVGAAMVRDKFGLDNNSDIINAIRYHTYGRIGMSELEKVVYIADFIEPNRTYNGVDEIRDRAFKGLDEVVMYANAENIKYLIDKNAILHINSIYLYNWLLKIHK